MTNASETIDVPGQTSTRERASAQAVAGFLTKWLLPISTILLMLFFSEMSPVFFTLDNLLAVVAQNAPTLIVTSVFALLLMAGYVDLSVGSMMALVGVISGITIINWGMTAGIFVGIAVGTGLGALNGALVGILRMSPIVVTLGGLAAERGMAQYLGQGSVYGFPDPFVDFGSGSIAGIPNLALIAGIICTVVAVTSECLPIGKRVIAIGVNPRAAYLVGVRVTAIVFGLYTLTGVAVGVAGLLLIARLNSAPSGTLGTGFEVTVLTAVLLGGVPFTGGRGSIWRVMVGVWLMSILRNGLILLNVGTEVSGIITGGVLVCAAVLEALRARLKLSA